MSHRDGYFTGPGSLRIYYRYWEPEVAPKAVILLAHGAGEHGDRYQHLAHYLNSHGYVVAAEDHPGHGKSDGVPGFIPRFDDYVQTLHIFQQQLLVDFPRLPLILLGHSMGGLISSLYLLQNQQAFTGCILSGPAIKTELEPGVFLMLTIRVLSALFPRVGVLQLDATGVSRDPAEVAKYVNDPLVYHGKLSARKVAELFKAMRQIQDRAQQITLPMLLLHGAEDSMAAPAGSKFLHDRISSTDKTLKIYPGLYHEIFNEPEQQAVFAELLAWCDERLKTA